MSYDVLPPELQSFAKKIVSTLGSEYKGYKLNGLKYYMMNDHGENPDDRAKKLGYESLKEVLEMDKMGDFVMWEDIPNEDGNGMTRIYKIRPNSTTESIYKQQRVSAIEAKREEFKRQQMLKREFGARDGNSENHWNNPDDGYGNRRMRRRGDDRAYDSEFNLSSRNYSNRHGPHCKIPPSSEVNKNNRGEDNAAENVVHRIPAPSKLPKTLYVHGLNEPQGLDDYYDEIDEEGEDGNGDYQRYKANNGRQKDQHKHDDGEKMPTKGGIGSFGGTIKSTRTAEANGGNNGGGGRSPTGNSSRPSGDPIRTTIDGKKQQLSKKEEEEEEDFRGPDWRYFDVVLPPKQRQQQNREKEEEEEGTMEGKQQMEGKPDIWEEEESIADEEENDNDEDDDDDDYQTVFGDDEVQGGTTPRMAFPPAASQAQQKPSNAMANRSQQQRPPHYQQREPTRKVRRDHTAAVPEAILVDLNHANSTKEEGSAGSARNVREPMAPSPSIAQLEFPFLEEEVFHKNRLVPSETLLLIGDMQEMFRPYIECFKEIVEVTRRMIATAKLLGIKIIATEQKTMGQTVPELNLQGNAIPMVEKTKFSMCIPSVRRQIPANVKSILICGIETHVCVYQSALGFQHLGFNVHVISDGTSTQRKFNRQSAYRQLDRFGAIVTTSECAILSLVGDSAHEKYEQIRNIIRGMPDTGLLNLFF